MLTRRAAFTAALAALGSTALPATTTTALPRAPAAGTPAPHATPPRPAPSRPAGARSPGRPLAATLPRPTGRHPVATLSVPLTDTTRTDPFAPHPGPRELMVQLWYPATTAPPRPSAPYTDPGTAAALEVAWGMRPGVLAAVTTHARTGDLSSLGARTGGPGAGGPRTGSPGAGGPRTGGRPAPGTRTAVVLSHGRGASRALTSGLAEELASRGHLVAAVDHTYDAAAVRFPDGRLVRGALPAEPDDWDAQDRLEVAVRAADLRCVADALCRRRRPLAGVAVRRVGLLGHSLGGAAAAEAMRLDRRFVAGLDLDGGLFGTTVPETGLDRPFLLLTSSPDHPTWARWRAHHRHWGRHLHLAGGGHLTATDVPALAHAAGLRERWPEPLYAEFLGTLAPARAAAVTRAYTTAFFDKFLLGHRRPLLDGPVPRYPEIEFRWTRGR
ncbi:alpha/beta hydrolase [Streptomyces bacillaris]|uniref:alpha/beta hydrolase n=1 Tax=Streptomyces bacillaris TaxID=68179 RepID=UPI003467ABB3